MIHRFKSTALAFGATTVACVAIISTASAAQFHAENPGPIAIFGQQTTQIVLASSLGAFKCNQVTFEGVVPSSGGAQTTAQAVTLTPIITGCTQAGIAATADTNGCKLTITGEPGGANTVVADITGCTAGKVLQFTSGACTATIPEQHGLGHAVAQNNSGPPKDFEVDLTIQGITNQRHGTCPNQVGETETKQDGSLTGKITFQAREYKGTQQSTHNGHQYEKLKLEGAQVGLLAT